MDTRFVIVTPGRTGSSLLAAILSDSGANFGVGADDWNASEGAFEHPDLIAAADSFSKARRLGIGRPLAPKKYLWDVYRHIGKARLKIILHRVEYLKGPDLDLVVRPIFNLGFFPQVIVNFRTFFGQAQSLYMRSAHHGFEALHERYCRIASDALLQITTFGGCVIDYDDIVDPANDDWIGNLAALTGLDADRLRQARKARVKTRAREEPGYEMDCRASRLYADLQSLRGSVFQPSRAALRHFTKRPD